MFLSSSSKLDLLPVLLLFLALSSQPNVIISAPLSTIAVSHISDGTAVVVCSLLPSVISDKRHNLTCTTLPDGRVETYDPSCTDFYSAVAAGDGFLCGIGASANTSVMRWWDLEHSSDDWGTSTDYKRVYRGPPILKLSTGDSRVCAVLDDRLSPRPYCWRWPEISFPDKLNFSDISVGGDFVCGLLSNGGEIRCFGSDATAVVGSQPNGSHVLVAAGSRHACAVSDKGELMCWGVGAPKIEQFPLGIVALESGRDNTCALSCNGTVQCWGANSELPSHLANSQFMAIEARGQTLCGILKATYSLVCWGSELLTKNPVIYERVIPGACVPQSSCTCGVLADSSNMCPEGNIICDLCEMNIQINPPPSTPPTSQANSNGTGGGGRKRRIILIAIAWACAGLVVLGCVLFVLLRQPRHKIHDQDGMRPAASRMQLFIPCVRAGPRSGGDQSYSTSPSQPPLSATYSKPNAYMIEEFPLAVLHDATENFSEHYKIGSGSFGSVYRAVLDDGRVVAIKRAESLGSRSGTAVALVTTPRNHQRCDVKESAFMSEIALLSRVNHKNLVRLLGYCRQSAERVLVYEIMANGTLHDQIHNRRGSNLGSWRARLQVALDAARGIEYLHVYAVPPIIHRDIKSSNILLDDAWTARVSDFGLSLMNPGQDELDSAASGSFGMAGTIGYIDPESFRLQNMTTKSDVYSFGVVLLELLTGRKAIHKYDDEDEDDEGSCGTPTNLVEFAVPHILDDNLHQVLDPQLSPPTPCEIEAVTYVSYLAADCVIPEGKDRPSMTEVVTGLERAVDALGVPGDPSASRADVSCDIIGLGSTSLRCIEP